MSEDEAGQVREQDEASAPVAYIRRASVGSLVPMGLLAGLASLLVTIFGFLLSSYRDTQNQLSANFVSYSAANAEQHKQIWGEVQTIQRFLCSKFTSWSRCK